MVLLLLSACDFYPETVDSDPLEVPYGDCDPRIFIPVGLLDEAPSDPADRHQALFGAEPEPFQVRLQWPGRDPSTSAGMLWRTDVDTLASLVELGPAEGFPANAVQVEGASFLFGSGKVGEGDYRMHEVRLCDQLQPGTTYSYRVGGEGHWSAVQSFTTPGTPGSFGDVRVAMSGDSRGAYATWNQLLTAAEAHEPDLFLFSGDMVEFGSSQSEWEAWFEASGDFLSRRALIPAHGNHEFIAQNYFAQFALPGNEEWFAYDYGDLLIVSLNDTVRDPEQLASDQVAYLDQVLGGSDARWKIVMHHQPVYSTCTTHGSNELLRELWTPIFDKHDVDVVMAGHNHIYERSKLIRGGVEATDGSGTLYLVSGGAGAPLYTGSEEEWFGHVATSVEHYVVADFGQDSASFVARDLEGNVIDSFTLEK